VKNHVVLTKFAPIFEELEAEYAWKFISDSGQVKFSQICFPQALAISSMLFFSVVLVPVPAVLALKLRFSSGNVPQLLVVLDEVWNLRIVLQDCLQDVDHIILRVYLRSALGLKISDVREVALPLRDDALIVSALVLDWVNRDCSLLRRHHNLLFRRFLLLLELHERLSWDAIADYLLWHLSEKNSRPRLHARLVIRVLIAQEILLKARDLILNFLAFLQPALFDLFKLSSCLAELNIQRFLDTFQVKVTQLDFFVLQFVVEILEVPFKMFKALFQIGPVRLNVSFIV